MAPRRAAKYDYPFLETFEGPQAFLINGPDSLHDTVVPRVERAGGNGMRVNNFDKIFVDDPANEREGDRNPNLITDFAELAWAVRRNKDVRLVAIDPIEAFCEHDRHLPKLLRDLDALAAECGVAIVVTSGARTKKDEFGRPRAVTRRSHDSARCVWGLTELAGTDADAGLRLFLPTRLNFCKAPEGIAFRITDEGAVAWEKVPQPKSKEMSQVEAAGVWLRDRLADGDAQADLVIRQAASCGIAKTTLFRARTKIGASTRRVGFGDGAKYYWSLKTEEQVAAEAAQEKRKVVEPRKEKKKINFDQYRYLAIEDGLAGGGGAAEVRERMEAREAAEKRLAADAPPAPTSVPAMVLIETRERLVAQAMEEEGCDEAEAWEIVQQQLNDLRRACDESITRERASLGLGPYVSRRAMLNGAACGNGHAGGNGALDVGE